jgi:hypothetical protein
MTFTESDLDRVLFAIASEDNGSHSQTKKTDGRKYNGKNLTKEARSKGGKNAHLNGTAHEFTSDEARAAGQIGGKRSHKKSFQTDEEEA